MYSRLMMLSLFMVAPGLLLGAPDVPAGKSSRKVSLAYLPDRNLVGQKVDIYTRSLASQHQASHVLTLVLPSVLLIASLDANDVGSTTRDALFALDPAEEKKIRRVEKRLGYDLIVMPRQP